MSGKSKSKRGWLYFILFFWLCYQCLSNVSRYMVVAGNMRSLAVEINTLGPDGFKNHFTSILADSNITYDENEIDISVNRSRSLYELSVPFYWKLNFGVWAYEYQIQLQEKTHLWPDGIWPRAKSSTEQRNNL